jgi:formylmethanofuran dehydrogenase subunit E
MVRNRQALNQVIRCAVCGDWMDTDLAKFYKNKYYCVDCYDVIYGENLYDMEHDTIDPDILGFLG